MLLFLASFSLLAAQTFDADMSRQIQKETGIYKLTDKQKSLFQRWLDANYAKRETPLADDTETAPAPAPVLQDNINNGRYIRLSDSSTWEINAEDTPITQGWITPVEILVSKNDDLDYPYLLTNSLTGSKVRAKKISSIPKKGQESTKPSKPAPVS